MCIVRLAENYRREEILHLEYLYVFEDLTVVAGRCKASTGICRLKS